MIGQATTNSNGHIYFSAPEAGSYYFIEDQAPDGYVRADQKFTFSIDSSGRISGTTSFVNKPGSKGVKTGDDSDALLYLFLAIIAWLALAGLIFSLPDKKKQIGGKGRN